MLKSEAHCKCIAKIETAIALNIMVQQTLPVTFLLTSALILQPSLVLALPPSDDLPEEISRTEIITEARSPIDGKPLTAAEYLELQAELQTNPTPQPQLSPQLRNTVSLLKLRKFIKTVFPFIPIK